MESLKAISSVRVGSDAMMLMALPSMRGEACGTRLKADMPFMHFHVPMWRRARRRSASQLTRRLAICPAERPDERRIVGVAAGQPDLVNRQARMHQQVAGALHAHLPVIVPGAEADVRPKGPVQLPDGNAETAGDLRDGLAPLHPLLHSRDGGQDQIVADAGAQPQLKLLPVGLRADAIMHEPLGDPARHRLAMMPLDDVE